MLFFPGGGGGGGGGGARVEKKNATFWSKFSKKFLKMPFLACFIKSSFVAQKTWSKWGVIRCESMIFKIKSRKF